MALLKSTVNPNHYLRVSRTSALMMADSYKDSEGNTVPEKVTLKVGYQVFRSADDRALWPGDQFVVPVPGSVDYTGSNIVFADTQGLTPEEFLLKTCYLSLLNDPTCANEWVSDET